jgi:hypothetical protein
VFLILQGDYQHTINESVYYVSSDKLHGYMFRPPSSHFQAVKIHKITDET